MIHEQTHIFGKQDSAMQGLLHNQVRETIGTAHIGDSREIILMIKGYKEIIHISEGHEFELGRFEYPTQTQLSLIPYRALESGISRQHAKLYLVDSRLYIADMDSTNGTYIHGKMLQPAEPTLLRNGDEILLGRLRIKVAF